MENVNALLPLLTDGYDDKTIFLLKVIHKYLKDDLLRCLLPEDENGFLSKCLDIMKPGMCLVCRLFWRQRGWYRRNDLKKIFDNTCAIDDPHLEIIIHSLIQIGCLESSESSDSTKIIMDFDDYVQVLKLDELKAICKELKLKGQNKAQLIKSLKSFSSQQFNISNYFIGLNSNNASRVMKRLRVKTGSCYRLTERAHRTLTKLLYLMYLGMDYAMIREKKLELLLLNDKVKKETYPIGDDMPIDNAGVVFSNKDEFESYFNACLLLERWEEAQNLTDKVEIIGKVYDTYRKIGEDKMIRYKSLPPWLRRFTPAYLFVRVLEGGVQELKRTKEAGNVSLAAEIVAELLSQRAFRQHKRPDWYAERALLLHNHLGCHDAAAEVLLEGLRSDLTEEAKQAMQPRALKLATMRSNRISQLLRGELAVLATGNALREVDFDAHHIHQKPMERFNNRGKIKFETRSVTGERIFLEAEQFCIRHYISRGDFTHGEHWEGRLVTTIFFLLFWDIIYMRLPGVRGIFLTKFSMYPQDMFTDSFYVNRKTLIDERLATIENMEEDELVKTMKETWDSRPESERSGIERALGWERVDAVGRCLGGRGVASLCRRLALNFRYANSGFPDLTLWNSTTKQIMFVEVKTDSDTPSVKQLQWLRYLRECGLRVQLCYVGADTTRQRARGPHCELDEE
ncbi:unnamed protein product, partial [Iphiclides podalirius]